MRSHRLGPAVAGTWYPDDPGTLRETVDGLLRGGATRDADGGRVTGLIAPHAGFVYSGRVAADGFRLVRGASCTRVLLMGPSHYAGFRGASLPDASEYATPLGDIPLDAEALATLADRSAFRVDSKPFGPEHCLEAELPFLQRSLEPGWRLVPVLIGGRSEPEDLSRIAEALAPLAEDDCLVVVSSDFTHFGPRFGYVPFRSDVANRLRELDLGAIRRIESGDASAFERYLAETGATICGRDAIGVLLRMFSHGSRPKLVTYDTSGRITGDWEHSVSYASLVLRSTA